MSIQLIIGLGNPGNQYQHTRHNAGCDLLTQIAQSYQASWVAQTRLKGKLATVSIAGKTVRLFIPSTFMNQSGVAAAAVTHFFKIDIKHILIAHDELDLSVGTVRLKQGGGHGGHNGLRDIISHLGNDNTFSRIRIGIGHPGHANKVLKYVLQKPSPDEAISIDHGCSSLLKVLDKVVQGHWQLAVNELHTSHPANNMP